MDGEIVFLTADLAAKLQELLDQENAEKRAISESAGDQTHAPNTFIVELVMCGEYFGAMDAPLTPPEDSDEEDLMPITSPPRELYDAKIISFSSITTDFYETVRDVLLMECSDIALTTGKLYLARSIGSYNVGTTEDPEDKTIFITQAGGGGGGPSDTIALDILVCAAPGSV